MSPSIFLSHSHQDRESVRELASDLACRGVRVWYYEAEIKVGESLMEKIGAAIQEMNFLGVVLTKNSVCSDWVRLELEIAIAKAMNEKSFIILPLLFENCQIPLFLSGRKYADFRNVSEYYTGLDQVLISLGILDKARDREDLLDKARKVWNAKAVLYSLGLENWSQSDLYEVPERDNYYDLLDAYNAAVKVYEATFQEFYDPLSFFNE